MLLFLAEGVDFVHSVKKAFFDRCFYEISKHVASSPPLSSTFFLSMSFINHVGVSSCRELLSACARIYHTTRPVLSRSLQSARALKTAYILKKRVAHRAYHATPSHTQPPISAIFCRKHKKTTLCFARNTFSKYFLLDQHVEFANAPSPFSIRVGKLYQHVVATIFNFPCIL